MSFPSRDRFHKVLGDRPGKISANERDKFIIETKNEQQSKKMTEMITILGKSCIAEQHRTLQGYVCNYEYDINNIDSFEAGLRHGTQLRKSSG